MDRINKSKEEGWKSLVDSLEDNKEVQSMCVWACTCTNTFVDACICVSEEKERKILVLLVHLTNFCYYEKRRV